MDKSLSSLANPYCTKCGGTGERHNGYFSFPCNCVRMKPLTFNSVTEVGYSSLKFETKEIFDIPSEERELLKKLFKAIKKLDIDYCTICNRMIFPKELSDLLMSGEEYEEINDLLIEVGEFLGED